MKTTTHEFHNPDNLTPEQIGEGYRLLLNEEVKPRDSASPSIERWNDSLKAWKNNDGEGFSGSNHYYTYRVPLSTWPLPEEAPTDNDRWESLLRTNSMLEKRVKELEEELALQKESASHWNDMHTVASISLSKYKEELTAAQARLEQLEWRPVSVKPTKEDADAQGFVQVAKRSGITAHYRWQADLQAYEILHWRPAALPAIPDQSRVEFEKWWSEKYNGEVGAHQVEAWEIWKAARAKEEKP